jgi:hypothetical protein
MAFPSTDILDNFIRANQNLSTSDDWTADVLSDQADLTIVSHRVQNQTEGFAADYWDAATYQNCEVFANMTDEESITYEDAYLYARIVNPGTSSADGYAASFESTGAETGVAYLYRVDDGELTELGSVAQAFQLGHQIGMRIDGSTITLWYESEQILTATDATYSAAGYIGMGLADMNGGLEAFGGGTYISAVPPTSVTIDGLATDDVDERYTYTSSYLPADAGTPLTYLWSTDGLLSGQGTATAIYRWDTEGIKTVTLTLSNAGGSVSDSHTVNVIRQKSLVAAITYLQAKMLEIDGMRESQTYPPDKIGSFPFSTCYPGAGVLSLGDPQGAARGEHSLVLEIHVARKDLPGDTERVWPFFDRISDKLNGDETLGDTVDTIVGNITYQFTTLGYFGTQTIGWQFIIPIKQVRIKIGA